MKRIPLVALMLFALAPFHLLAQDDGYVSMFNGKDLTGWVNVNCAPSTFFVKDNEIVTTGKPTGFLRTEKQYENFIMEFEWMHINKKDVGNSGCFVWADPLPAQGTPYARGIEVQVLVNLTYKDKNGAVTASSHGDLFSIHGAKCKPDRPHPAGAERCIPSEFRAKGGGEWNHYKIVANDGVIKLHVNGKEVSGVSACTPRKGYLALESEGAECHFRNLKIKELPSTNVAAKDIANVAEGHKNLFTGLDLSGWKEDEGIKKHWTTRDWVLRYDGKGAAKEDRLETGKEIGDCEILLDFRFPVKNAKRCAFQLRGLENQAGRVVLTLDDGKGAARYDIVTGVLKGNTISNSAPIRLKAAGQWNRLIATVTSDGVQLTFNGVREPAQKVDNLPARGTFGLQADGEMEFGNLFVRELKK